MKFYPIWSGGCGEMASYGWTDVLADGRADKAATIFSPFGAHNNVRKQQTAYRLKAEQLKNFPVSLSQTTNFTVFQTEGVSKRQLPTFSFVLTSTQLLYQIP